MPTNDLNELILAIQKKDMNALEQLYITMKASVYGLAYVYTGSHSDADDIVQNTFLHIWNRADKYKEKSPRSWIMTIARNLSIDYIRASKRFTELNDDIRAEDEYETIADSDFLHTLLKNLDESEREIVLLYSHGLSHAEIAKVVSRPYATVRWKYSNAIKKMIKITGGGSND